MSAQSLLDALLRHLGAQGDTVENLQRRLTAFRALGPENGGDGEMPKARQIAELLGGPGSPFALCWRNAPDERVSCGERPNLIAHLPGREDRTLWLFAHTDVVPAGAPDAWTSDPWTVRREGDLLYGRGVEDNQQGLVSMLLLADALRAALQTGAERPPLGLGLVFMADEECGNARGLQYVLEQAGDLFRPGDFYIVPDSGSPDGSEVEVAEKHVLWLRVRTAGRQCHASQPQCGVNAFVAGADAVLACAALAEDFPQTDALFQPPCSTFVPTRHEGGADSINILPGDDCFYVDCRLLPEVRPESVLEAARARTSAVARRHGVEITVDIHHHQAASVTPQDSPVVAALAEAVAAVYGVEARPVGIGGATVAALLRRQGLPAVVWSRLRNTCHQPDEHSSIAATIGDAEVFAHVLCRC